MVEVILMCNCCDSTKEETEEQTTVSVELLDIEAPITVH
jgi:hypothetical protein